MEAIWRSSYPAGVPAEIDINEYASLVHLFDDSVKRFGDRRAFTCMGASLSFHALDEKVTAFAAYLQSLGLKKGDRVALMMPNILQYPVALFGVLKAGMVVVNTNPLYTPRELEHQLKDSGAEVIVVLENFAHVLQQVVAHTAVKQVLVTGLGDLLPGLKGHVVNFAVRHIKKLVPLWTIKGALPFTKALAAGAKLPFTPPSIGHEDLAFLQYTGGTTGVAKGAMLLHRNIVANLLQARAWIKPFLSDHDEVIITALPLYHIFSLTANCLTFMTLGAENILIPNPRDIPGFVKEMGKYRFTAITGVNTLFNALLNNPDFAKLDFSHLRCALGGGMAVQRAVAERWKKVTGVTLVEAYGLTETSPAALINPLNIPEYNGSIGVPISSTWVELRDDDGHAVPLGQAGEICIHGPQVMAGYWRQPQETAKVLDSQGYFATGDIGVMDEHGFVRIVDRKKDMILVSGFNVYPNEIENVVMLHAAVLEVAAVGLPDDRTGEAVKIFVVKKDDALTADQLIAHCRANLTAYKVPRGVEFRSELPKTNVGKILRRLLRDEALAGKEPSAPQ